jgi:hypothetical protein
MPGLRFLFAVSFAVSALSWGVEVSYAQKESTELKREIGKEPAVAKWKADAAIGVRSQRDAAIRKTIGVHQYLGPARNGQALRHDQTEQHTRKWRAGTPQVHQQSEVGKSADPPGGHLPEPPPASVPESRTMLLLGAGVFGVAVYAKRRNNE